MELVIVRRDYLIAISKVHEREHRPTDSVAPDADGELRFNHPAHTYDLDNGQYLGYGKNLKLRVGAYTVRTLARLPYRVVAIDLHLDGQARLGDTIRVVAALATQGGQPRSHYLRLDVLNAEGRPMRHLGREVMADAGSATFALPTAFNDPPGSWTLVVSDVGTGTQAKIAVNLGPRPSVVPQPEPFATSAIED